MRSTQTRYKNIAYHILMWRILKKTIFFIILIASSCEEQHSKHSTSINQQKTTEEIMTEFKMSVIQSIKKYDSTGKGEVPRKDYSSFLVQVYLKFEQMFNIHCECTQLLSQCVEDFVENKNQQAKLIGVRELFKDITKNFGQFVLDNPEKCYKIVKFFFADKIKDRTVQFQKQELKEKLSRYFTQHLKFNRDNLNQSNHTIPLENYLQVFKEFVLTTKGGQRKFDEESQKILVAALKTFMEEKEGKNSYINLKQFEKDVLENFPTFLIKNKEMFEKISRILYPKSTEEGFNSNLEEL